MIKKKLLPQLFPLFNEHWNFLTTKNIEKFVKNLNRSNIFFVLNFEPKMIDIPQKTLISHKKHETRLYFFLFEKCCYNVNITQNERKQRFEIPFNWIFFALFKSQFRQTKQKTNNSKQNPYFENTQKTFCRIYGWISTIHKKHCFQYWQSSFFFDWLFIKISIFLVQHDIDQMTFDKIVFIYQIL